MRVERHLQSLTCLNVSRLSNDQLCPHVTGMFRSIAEILCLFFPPLSFHFLIEENPFMVQTSFSRNAFLCARKSLKSNPKRWTIPLCVHDEEVTLKTRADIYEILSKNSAILEKERLLFTAWALKVLSFSICQI